MRSPQFLFSLFICLAVFATCSSCDDDNPPPPPPSPAPTPPSIPAFNADSAYNDIAAQLAFGPRVIGSEGHAACKDWLVERFRALGARVQQQQFTADLYTGASHRATNIIAQINPDVSDRLLLCAHWDTRHIADSPLNTERLEEPILGADDGGSGVAVLLEIARRIQENPIGIGIDIVLFDAEDHGESGGAPESYCLGSQYWSRNRPTPYKPRYGILLDMVGAEGAQFPIEGYSAYYAQPIVDKVWGMAKRMGRTNYFINRRMQGGITDDHYFVNTLAGIPTIDIINLSGTTQTSFGPHWHTHDDDMDIIDKNTLRAVGQVLLAVLYNEDAGLL
ncbi:MAG: M28 family peptidase [Bacteroidota bacterium]